MGNNILLTGRPGVGKTTVIRRVVEALTDVAGSNGGHGPEPAIASGFYTQEMRVNGKREGFYTVTLDGREALLASIHSSSPLRVSSYGVELEAFEREIIPAIDPTLTDAPLVIMDEIGLMEIYSTLFRETVLRTLSADRIVLGTIGQRGNGYLTRIRDREDVELVEVTAQNRESLVGELVEQIRRLLSGER